ncbi:MAG TPA: hypothetical protein VEI03_21385, partial [Stellaceae bacterium]|nr:hypothetical protein [Stellaceae bacterium]
SALHLRRRSRPGRTETSTIVCTLTRQLMCKHLTPAPSQEGGRHRAHTLQKAMVFELSMVRAESLLSGNGELSWDDCLQLASERQRRHYDARVPDKLEQCDLDIATHAAQNLFVMINRIQNQNPDAQLEKYPVIPGLGWIASGNGDFSLGSLLIEVKHTDRNFVSSDFRQVMMYWLLKYAEAIENSSKVWSDVLLLNPRRNSALLVKFDYLLRSASASASRVELFELLRSIVGQDLDRW